MRSTPARVIKARTARSTARAAFAGQVHADRLLATQSPARIFNIRVPEPCRDFLELGAQKKPRRSSTFPAARSPAVGASTLQAPVLWPRRSAARALLPAATKEHPDSRTVERPACIRAARPSRATGCLDGVVAGSFGPGWQSKHSTVRAVARVHAARHTHPRARERMLREDMDLADGNGKTISHARRECSSGSSQGCWAGPGSPSVSFACDVQTATEAQARPFNPDIIKAAVINTPSVLVVPHIIRHYYFTLASAPEALSLLLTCAAGQNGNNGQDVSPALAVKPLQQLYRSNNLGRSTSVGSCVSIEHSAFAFCMYKVLALGAGLH